jgi:hypothetical protein
LFLTTKKTNESRAASALGMSAERFRLELRRFRLPNFSRVAGVCFGLHVDHWVRRLRLSTGEIADRAGFVGNKALDQYVRRNCGISCSQFAGVVGDSPPMRLFLEWLRPSESE